MAMFFLTATAVLVLTISLQTDATIEEPWFEFSCGIKAYDDAYKLAMTEMGQNIENGTFIAGAGWKQLWTRDTSYAVELAAGLVHPELSKKSLEKSTEVDKTFGQVWLQDVCGHFGGWPHLSDAIVGIRGSFELFCITGDVEFLSWAYEITKNSLKRAERDAYDSSTGLFRGCSSFMESDSGYPEKYSMNGTKVGLTKALSTNMLYYEGFKLGARMGQILGADNNETLALDTKAKLLRESIRSRLWFPEHGYYSYFEDEDGSIVPQMEGLGESLVLLGTDFERDADRIKSIFENTFQTERGIPSLWPRFVYPKDSACESQWIECYYHNGRIWPFVSGYWALAAARHGQTQIFAHEFESLAWLSQQKNTFAEFYEIDGTFPKERSRQLWSDTGFLCLVYHGLFGLKFLPEGIEFHPVKPASLFPETISLRGVHYRNMTLDIHVSGTGSDIASVKVNEHQLQKAFVSASLKGSHSIFISLESGNDSDSEEEAQEDRIETKQSVFGMVATVVVVLIVMSLLRNAFRSKASLRRFCPSVIGQSESERLTQ